VKASSQASWVASQPKTKHSANHSRISYGSKAKDTSRLRLDTKCLELTTISKLKLKIILSHLHALDVEIDILLHLYCR
jgi:hypothetical protein